MKRRKIIHQKKKKEEEKSTIHQRPDEMLITIESIDICNLPLAICKSRYKCHSQSIQ